MRDVRKLVCVNKYLYYVFAWHNQAEPKFWTQVQEFSYLAPHLLAPQLVQHTWPVLSQDAPVQQLKGEMLYLSRFEDQWRCSVLLEGTEGFLLGSLKNRYIYQDLRLVKFNWFSLCVHCVLRSGKYASTGQTGS